MFVRLIAISYLLLAAIAEISAQSVGNLNCDFEGTVCSWSNVWRDQKLDDFNWKLGSGSKGAQRGSGTSSGYNGSRGYMYIKSKNWVNRTAMLMSPSFTRTYPSCLKFFYYMKGAKVRPGRTLWEAAFAGRTMGHLAVYKAESRQTVKQTQKLLWNLRGHQGGRWMSAKIPLPAVQNAVVVFEAFDWRKGRSGNILIDQVSLTRVTKSNPCSLTPSYAQPTANNTIDTTSLPMMPLTSTVASPTTPALSQKTSRPAFSPLNTSLVVTPIIQTEKASSSEAINAATFETTPIVDATVSQTPANTSAPTGGMLAPNDSKMHVVGIVLGVLVGLCIVLVGLALYVRRRRKPRTMYADDCSVTMTRMYPNIAGEPHIDYRKLT